MSAPAMIAHLLLERLTRHCLPRTPEDQGVMEAAEQVAAFADSGREQGILAYIYLFHAALSLPVIRSGDRVLDLACGPANQLAQIARLNRDCQFVGVDASQRMLGLARDTLARENLDNVTLRHGDVTCLNDLAAASFDAVLCTMSLHHLNDVGALTRALAEVRRVLKPDGGLFLADFGRLKRAATQRFFAYDRADMQSAPFTLDFLHSMRAAFSFEELQNALTDSRLDAHGYHTALAPFMMIFRSASRRELDPPLVQRVQAAFRQLDRGLQRDFDNLARWFGLGGLPLPCPIR
ncbi:MAG: class I SAM-dependent methyltransferase [Paludibacterium sp.]|uniref:class I SAM-dependent methyltransferase n=1 Tax=Paludibacterium sp. TaxID=1917523 RepID=UPI0025D1B488|nr:class I SAM-dependent methyltransferase [Paludibacterium sp.]MBV8047883.1 class I SAM-dependent methyltransferase [Paludibacterium sp.]MBV8649738.1 class I SAM-dependent methyltransferase [Paludibacterium sp.]